MSWKRNGILILTLLFHHIHWKLNWNQTLYTVTKLFHSTHMKLCIGGAVSFIKSNLLRWCGTIRNRALKLFTGNGLIIIIFLFLKKRICREFRSELAASSTRIIGVHFNFWPHEMFSESSCRYILKAYQSAINDFLKI